MFRSRELRVSVSIAKRGLESVFDECDRYDTDETGGRLIGHYCKNGSDYDIGVLGVIGPGPNARRSETSFFQDGEYQEGIFRLLEEEHPNIEHLGNWHTHHVNGFPTLSAGDKSTYFKTVNHNKHNTDFFYALLVVRKNHGSGPRYEVKHYFFRRGVDEVYEIPNSQVQIVDIPVLWPRDSDGASTQSDLPQQHNHQSITNFERARDQEFFSDFCPNLKPLYSKRIGALYWRGSLSLIDGSQTEIVAIEDVVDGALRYSIITSDDNPRFARVSAIYKERRFSSARSAVLHLERDLNQMIYWFKKEKRNECNHG